MNKTTLAAIYDKDDNLVQRFEYGLSNTPITFTQDGNKYYITSDHLGSPRTISDVSGNVLKAIEYDSFGNVISDTNPTLEIPFGFAGGLHDKDTNLIRFGYRDYDPETGRWTARDPIGFAGGDTNLYGYVASDPVNFVDKNGLSRLIRRQGFGGGGTNGGAGGRQGQVIGNGYMTPNGRYIPPSIPVARPQPRPKHPPLVLPSNNSDNRQETIRQLLNLLEDADGYNQKLKDYLKDLERLEQERLKTMCPV